MQGRFLQCLAVTLREETGYPQPVGGPYVRMIVTDQTNKIRVKHGEAPLPLGKYWNGGEQLRHETGILVDIPQRPDSMCFDDDPDDTGGRTAAGLLQREYDPWRRSEGLPTRDVWLITDREIEAIYLAQYWTAVSGDALPPSVDLLMFDFGVLCGVGTAVRHLQRALGAQVDGHLGQVTLDAARGVPAVDLIEQLRQERAAYHRQCKTFWKHGEGWLARNNRVARDAVKMISRGQTSATLFRAPSAGRITLIGLPNADPAAAPDAVGDDPSEIARRPKAELPAEPATMGQSSTAQAATVAAGGGIIGFVSQIGQTAQAIVQRGETLTPSSLALDLVSSPVFIGAVITILGGAYIWLERRRRLYLQQRIG